MRHGVGVPIQDNDPEHWASMYPNIPFLTWNSAYGHISTHMPMIWRMEQLQSSYPPGTPIVLINEPEYEGQANLTFEQAATVIRRFRDWDGMVYGCGTAWFGDGYRWMTGFVEYMGDEIDILDGMHLHCYSNSDHPELYDDYAQAFADIARFHNWPIIISEYGIIGANDQQRDTFVQSIKSFFDPKAMFIFSWRYHLIPQLDLAYADDSLTDIGEWWFRMTRRDFNIYLPYVSS
jgi:hypothetical protein